MEHPDGQSGDTAPSIKNPRAAIDPGQIYPTASANLPTTQDERRMKNEQAKIISGAELESKGYRIGHEEPKSKEVDIVGGLIIIAGVSSILLNHSPISIAFSAVYVTVGLGIILRSATARKIVIYMSAFGLVMNILALFSTSIFLSGKASIWPILSILLSIIVQLVVLSVLTWHKNEAEFH